MKFSVKHDDLEAIMTSCKFYTNSKHVNPKFHFIQCKIEGGFLKASSADGNKIRCITVPCEGNDSEFTMPLISVPKSRIDYPVSVTIEDGKIKFDFMGSSITETASKEEFADFEKFIPEGETKFAIGFTTKNLQAALSGIKSEYIKIKFFSPLSACIVEEQNGNKSIVLPAKVWKEV